MDFKVRKFLNSHWEKLIHLSILASLFCFLFFQGVNIYNKQSTKKLSDDYGRELERAILWLKDNSKPEDIVLSEWIRGHQIIALSGRRVVATTKVYPSEAKKVVERYKDIARFFFADSEEEALGVIEKYQVKFIFVPKSFNWSNCQLIAKCDYQGGTIIDRMIWGDEFNNFFRIYESPNFLIFKVEESSAKKVFAGFPENYYSKFIDLNKESFFSKFNWETLISGAILPHHLYYTGKLIADFFKNLASHQEIRTFVLIGPDHFDNNNAPITVSNLSWETPQGEAYLNIKIIQSLLNKKLVSLDNKVNEKEHSLKALIPFIKYYFPKAKIVPLILKNDARDEEILKLARELQTDNFQIFFLASINFSHRLSLIDTLKEDERSLVAIKNLDAEQAKNLNVEVGPTLSLLFSIMKKLGATNVGILNHSNNLELLREGMVETEQHSVPYLVSYFFAIFSH